MHGALLVGFISNASTLAIAHCRGDRAATPVAVGMARARFPHPVFLGDTASVECEIATTDLARRRSVANMAVKNQTGQLVAVADHILQWVPNQADSKR